MNRHTTETRVSYDNSTWHAINTGYVNSTKEASSKDEGSLKDKLEWVKYTPTPNRRYHTREIDDKPDKTNRVK